MMLYVPAAIILLYTAAVMIASALQGRIIFPRHLTGPVLAQRPPDPAMRALWLETAEGHRVEAWFAPGQGRSAADPGPAIIFAHGNGTLIDHAVDTADLYTSAGFSVMLCEYRGYGISGGAPSQHAIVADFVQFYDMLRRQPEVGDHPILGHGRSLGGGVIAQLAASRPLSAMTIESSFTSVVAVARRLLIPGFVCRSPFRTDRILRTYDGPVLLIHGTDDEIIPVSHSRRLVSIAADARLIELDARHNDLVFHPDYDDAVLSFVEGLGLTVVEPGAPEVGGD